MASDRRADFRRRALDLLERGGLPLLALLMFLYFASNSTSGEVFTNSANLKNILGNQAVTALVALAMVIPLVSGYLDLSVAATAGAGNVALASLIGPHQWALLPAILFVLVIGGFIGLLNGLLIARLRLNAFVVTLGTYTLVGGLTQLYTHGKFISEGIPASFGRWGSETWIGVPRPFLLLIAVAVCAWYLLSNTPFGRHAEGIGSSERAARLVGVNVTRTIWTSFVIAGSLAAIAGVLQTSRAGSGSAEVGPSFLFPAITAVFLGATTIRPGRYNVWGTVVGVYFVAISVSGFTLLGADTWVQSVFNGAALIVAVALTALIRRTRDRTTPVRAAEEGAHSLTNEDGIGSDETTATQAHQSSGALPPKR